MKFKSLLAVSLLLFSSQLSERAVDAFRFPSDLSSQDKKAFIDKVGKLEKRFNSAPYMRESAKSINAYTQKEPKNTQHGPIVQEHSSSFQGASSGGLIRDSVYAKYFNLQFDY